MNFTPKPTGAPRIAAAEPARFWSRLLFHALSRRFGDHRD